MDTRVFTIFFYPLLFSSNQEIEKIDGYTPEKWRDMENIYDSDEYAAITQSLSWARANPEFDYRSTIKGVKASNVALYKFLMRIAESYENYTKSV